MEIDNEVLVPLLFLVIIRVTVIDDSLSVPLMNCVDCVNRMA